MPSNQPAAGHLAVKPEYLSSQPSPLAKKSEPNRSKSYDPRAGSQPHYACSVADGMLAQKSHIADTKMTSANWHEHVNWLNTFLIGGVPIIGLIVALFTPLYWQTAVWSVMYYYATVSTSGADSPNPSMEFGHTYCNRSMADLAVEQGLGITAGYHRLWAHTSYSASVPLRIWLAAVGGGAVEGSVRWWARDHRAHHRYTDTDKDPYSVRKVSGSPSLPVNEMLISPRACSILTWVG